MGCGRGLVVSMLTYYSHDPSSNLAEAYSLSSKLLFELFWIFCSIGKLEHFYTVLVIFLLFIKSKNNFIVSENQTQVIGNVPFGCY